MDPLPAHASNPGLVTGRVKGCYGRVEYLDPTKVDVVEVGGDGSRVGSIADSLISQKLRNELWEGRLIEMDGERAESFWVVSFCGKGV